MALALGCCLALHTLLALVLWACPGIMSAVASPGVPKALLAASSAADAGDTSGEEEVIKGVPGYLRSLAFLGAWSQAPRLLLRLDLAVLLVCLPGAGLAASYLFQGKTHLGHTLKEVRGRTHRGHTQHRNQHTPQPITPIPVSASPQHAPCTTCRHLHTHVLYTAVPYTPHTPLFRALLFNTPFMRSCSVQCCFVPLLTVLFRTLLFKTPFMRSCSEQCCSVPLLTVLFRALSLVPWQVVAQGRSWWPCWCCSLSCWAYSCGRACASCPCSSPRDKWCTRSVWGPYRTTIVPERLVFRRTLHTAVLQKKVVFQVSVGALQN